MLFHDIWVFSGPKNRVTVLHELHLYSKITCKTTYSLKSIFNQRYVISKLFEHSELKGPKYKNNIFHILWGIFWLTVNWPQLIVVHIRVKKAYQKYRTCQILLKSKYIHQNSKILASLIYLVVYSFPSCTCMFLCPNGT